MPALSYAINKQKKLWEEKKIQSISYIDINVNVLNKILAN